MRLFSSTAVLFSIALLSAPSAFSADARIRIDYRVECDPSASDAFPAIEGSLRVGGVDLRFDLLKYETEKELLLPGVSPDSVAPGDLPFRFEPSTDCRLDSFSASLSGPASDPRRSLAIRHSPYVNVRNDQYPNREKDVPLGLAYSVSEPKPGVTRIRYTVYFSNESVHGPLATTKKTSMDHYGRRTDIEWVYEVDLDPSERILRESTNHGVFFGIASTPRPFRGRHLPGTAHPILYDYAIHNVFRGPKTVRARRNGNVGYLFVPNDEIGFPLAREWWMWRHPWSFDVSDRELDRDGERIAAADEFLYVEIRGEFTKGNFAVSLDPIGGPVRSSVVDRLGEDLWGKETFTGLFVGEASLDRARVEIRNLGQREALTLDRAPRFFRLVRDERSGFSVREISAECSPSAGGVLSVCELAPIKDSGIPPLRRSRPE